MFGSVFAYVAGKMKAPAFHILFHYARQSFAFNCDIATSYAELSKLFGTDLKSEYHKENEDSLIENVLDKYQKNDLY
jgi:hypothetical protein